MNYRFPIYIILLSFTFFSCANSGESDNPNQGNPLTGNVPPDSNIVSIPADHPLMQIVIGIGQKLDAMEKPEDFDLCFSSLMIIHHEGTIELAQYAIKTAGSELLKESARKMIVRHSGELKELKEITNHHKEGIITSEVHEELLQVIRKSKSRLTDDNLTGNQDIDYAELMIEHLQNGIDLATQEVLNGHHVNLKLMARDMISEMQDEQKILKSWLSTI